MKIPRNFPIFTCRASLYLVVCVRCLLLEKKLHVSSARGTIVQQFDETSLCCHRMVATLYTDCILYTDCTIILQQPQSQIKQVFERKNRFMYFRNCPNQHWDAIKINWFITAWWQIWYTYNTRPWFQGYIHNLVWKHFTGQCNQPKVPLEFWQLTPCLLGVLWPCSG